MSNKPTLDEIFERLKKDVYVSTSGEYVTLEAEAKQQLTQLIADIIGENKEHDKTCSITVAPSSGCDCGAAFKNFWNDMARRKAKERGIDLKESK